MLVAELCLVLISTKILTFYDWVDDDGDDDAGGSGAELHHQLQTIPNRKF